MMIFFSSAVRSRCAPDEEAGVAAAESDEAADGVRSDVVVLVDDPAQAASARLAAIAAIAFKGMVGKVRGPFCARETTNNRRQVANR